MTFSQFKLDCRATESVTAAQNELAGAEAGDGRDASNKSLQERLADAENAKVWYYQILLLQVLQLINGVLSSADCC